MIKAKITFETIIDETNIYDDLVNYYHHPLSVARKNFLKHIEENLKCLGSRLNPENRFSSPYKIIYEINET